MTMFVKKLKNGQYGIVTELPNGKVRVHQRFHLKADALDELEQWQEYDNMDDRAKQHIGWS